MQALHYEEGHPLLHQHDTPEILVGGEDIEYGVKLTPYSQVGKRPKKPELHNGVLVEGGVLSTKSHNGGRFSLHEVVGGHTTNRVAVLLRLRL